MVSPTRFAFWLLASVLLLAVSPQNAQACWIKCADGSECRGSDCHCDGSSAHCTGKETETLQSYISYLSRWNLQGLDRVAEAAKQMKNATDNKDSQGYFLSLLDHDAAVESLTSEEREIYSKFAFDREVLLHQGHGPKHKNPEN